MPVIEARNLTKKFKDLVAGEIHTGLLGSLAVIIGIFIVFFSIALVTMRRRLTV